MIARMMDPDDHEQARKFGEAVLAVWLVVLVVGLVVAAVAAVI